MVLNWLQTKGNYQRIGKGEKGDEGEGLHLALFVEIDDPRDCH